MTSEWTPQFNMNRDYIFYRQSGGEGLKSVYANKDLFLINDDDDENNKQQKGGGASKKKLLGIPVGLVVQSEEKSPTRTAFEQISVRVRGPVGESMMEKLVKSVIPSSSTSSLLSTPSLKKKPESEQKQKPEQKKKNVQTRTKTLKMEKMEKMEKTEKKEKKEKTKKKRKSQ